MAPLVENQVGKITWSRDRLPTTVSFPNRSVGKESTCSAGNPSLIPGMGRSPGEGKGCPLQYSGLENSMDCIVHAVAKSRTRLRDFHFHPLQYSWALLVAQMVKNPSAMQETWVQSLAWENPLEEGMATCILAWRISMDRGA